jgi:hypothetical protein
MDFDQEYSQRFDSRRERNIENLAELASIAHLGGPEILDALPGLVSSRSAKDQISALRWSILILWLQASECFILGQFEPCILSVGAVVERCLKLEYQVANGSMPSGNWTLGRCIYNLDWSSTRVNNSHLEFAKACHGNRDSRAHALLEHTDPALSMFGGDRGIQILSPIHYSIEPYRGEATSMISNAWALLDSLYSTDSEHAVSDAA